MIPKTVYICMFCAFLSFCLVGCKENSMENNGASVEAIKSITTLDQLDKELRLYLGKEEKGKQGEVIFLNTQLFGLANRISWKDIGQKSCLKLLAQLTVEFMNSKKEFQRLTSFFIYFVRVERFSWVKWPGTWFDENLSSQEETFLLVILWGQIQNGFEIEAMDILSRFSWKSPKIASIFLPYLLQQFKKREKGFSNEQREKYIEAIINITRSFLLRNEKDYVKRVYSGYQDLPREIIEDYEAFGGLMGGMATPKGSP